MNNIVLSAPPEEMIFPVYQPLHTTSPLEFKLTAESDNRYDEPLIFETDDLLD